MFFHQHQLEQTRDRRGFSMVELILVLAIAVIIASMAVAHFSRAYSSQYLKKGADRVRAEFNKARVRAMRTGDVHAFYYVPGSNQFAMGRYASRDQVVLDDPSVNRGQYQFFDQLLPAGVYFGGADVAVDSQAQLTQEQFSGDSGDMKPILFYGDGTAQNAKLTLTHEGGASIQVNLRGLTGLASTSKIIIEENR